VSKFLKNNNIKVDSVETFIWYFLVIVFVFAGKEMSAQKFFGGEASYFIYGAILLGFSLFFLQLSASIRGVELKNVFSRSEFRKRIRKQKRKRIEKEKN
jgi:hypothetical protein